jgi:nucleoside-diphosphate-sugar epimerase
MRVVVAGGTGFIGRRVVDRLRAAAVDVTTLSRHAPRTPAPGVRHVVADARDEAALGVAFAGADVLVQAVQFPNHPVERPSRGHTYWEFDALGTERAARAAQAAGVRRVVYLSGAGAGQALRQPWFRAKDHAEAAIRATGLEHVLLRPSWVYGPDDRSLTRFVWFCRHLPFVPVVGDGTTPVWPLHVDDLARCVEQSVLRPDLAAHAVDLGGPERLSMDDVVHTIQRVIARRVPILHQPVWLAKAGSLPLQLLPAPPLSPQAVDFITQTALIDPRPGQALFGLPFRTLEEGLRQDLAPPAKINR